jgi:hypothetical protein
MGFFVVDRPGLATRYTAGALARQPCDRAQADYSILLSTPLILGGRRAGR